MKELDLFSILAHAPIGLKLYSPIYGEVELNKIIEYKDIEVRFSNWEDYSEEEEMEYNGLAKENWFATFNNDGTFKYGDRSGECCLFPSKECRDWNSFQCPKVGDEIKTKAGQYTVLNLEDTYFNCENYDPDISYTADFKIIEEPKFKKGDFVIANNEIHKITEINPNTYGLEKATNTCKTSPISYEKSEIQLATKEKLRNEYNLTINKHNKLVRWKPEIGEKYYFIEQNDVLDGVNEDFDEVRETDFNCFPTEKMAYEAMNGINEYYKNYRP